MAQARALGFAAVRVFVAHPIQDRTDDGMRELADAAVDELVATAGRAVAGQRSAQSWR